MSCKLPAGIRRPQLDCAKVSSCADTGHRHLPATLASDSDSEDSASGQANRRPQTKRSMGSAATLAQDGLENALVVWQFHSIVRELPPIMNTEAAELEAGHAQEPHEQEQTVQADSAGQNVSVSAEEDEGRRAADALLHDPDS